MDTRSHSVNQVETDAPMTRSESVFHHQFKVIKDEEERKKANIETEQLDKKPRSSKGKGPSLNEKVAAANIKDWVKHIINFRSIIDKLNPPSLSSKSRYLTKKT
jgi:hypothetical protein